MNIDTNVLALAAAVAATLACLLSLRGTSRLKRIEALMSASMPEPDNGEVRAALARQQAGLDRNGQMLEQLSAATETGTREIKSVLRPLVSQSAETHLAANAMKTQMAELTEAVGRRTPTGTPASRRGKPKGSQQTGGGRGRRNRGRTARGGDAAKPNGSGEGTAAGAAAGETAPAAAAEAPAGGSRPGEDGKPEAASDPGPADPELADPAAAEPPAAAGDEQERQPAAQA